MYWQLRRQHLIWALESSRGCSYTGLGAAVLFCGSTALLWISDYMDIGLPFCFTALLWISSSTACATCDLLVISFQGPVMEVKTDVVVLLENIRCHQDDVPALKQSLSTLATMCRENGKSRRRLQCFSFS